MPYKTPTLKQSKAIDKIVQKGRPLTKSELKDIGYSKSVIEHPSRVNQSMMVQQAVSEVLKRNNITLDRAIKPIDRALEAKKQNQFTGEIEEDLTIQLKGSDRALKLLGVSNSNDSVPIDPKAVSEAITSNDTVELTKLVFSKTPSKIQPEH